MLETAFLCHSYGTLVSNQYLAKLHSATFTVAVFIAAGLVLIYVYRGYAIITSFLIQNFYRIKRIGEFHADFIVIEWVVFHCHLVINIIL
jgi:hypothetical protein